MKAIAILVVSGALALTAVASITQGNADALGPPEPKVFPTKQVKPHGNWGTAKAAVFNDFPLYSAGATVHGHGLNAIVRVKGVALPGEPVRADHVTFMYGSCASVNGEGCQVPLQIQIWNACDRRASTYEMGPGPPAITPDEELRIRGVPARFYEDGTRLELYTNKSTIVLYSDLPARTLLLDAAKKLKGVNVAKAAGASLPPPDAAAVKACP